MASSKRKVQFITRRLYATAAWLYLVSRVEAEQLLRQDGDFLVRESHQTPGQFVLTGMQVGNISLFLNYFHVFMQGQSRKHLLLVDPQGVVR